MGRSKAKLEGILLLAAFAGICGSVTCLFLWHALDSNILFALFIVLAVFSFIYFHSQRFKMFIMPKLRGLYWSQKCMGSCKKLSVFQNVTINHPASIEFGDNCDVLQGCYFGPVTSHKGSRYNPRIKVGKNVHFGEFDRIGCAYSVTIEDDVLFAAFVHITDHGHGYEDIDVPIHEQPIFSSGTVTIKRGTWLASGCRILSGVTIGENCVIGANAVVTKNIPPYSVAVGAPAKVIRKYNPESRAWE